jgi:hypothetical protein
MDKAKRLSKAESRKRLLAEWEKALQAGFGLSSVEASHYLQAILRKGDIPASKQSKGAQTFKTGLAQLLGNNLRNHINRTPVKTDTQLEAALQEVREAGEKMPTILRKAAKEFTRALPRRGGPGRQRKLNPNEASKVCDHIATFIRQGQTLKDALKKMAELSPSILGKKVGARTLQKAWDSRDKPTG